MSHLSQLAHRIGGLDGTVDQRLAEFAAAQHGVVAIWQLYVLGFSYRVVERRVAAGRLHRVYRGVYAVGHRKITPRGHLMAAVLACGSEGLLSHRSNAGLRSLLPDGRSVIDVTIPGRGSRRIGRRVVVHGARSLHPDDIDMYDGIPCTSVARMLLEVAGSSPRRHLERAFETAERERVLDLREVHSTLARSSGHRGTKPLLSIIEQLTDPPPNVRSEFERRVFEACDARGMPRPQLNVSVEGREVDMVWGRVLVELDSWKFHGTRAAFERDRERDVTLRLKGYIPLRFTWRQAIPDPDAFVATVQSATELASAA